MSTCYRDGDGGRAALCDPATGWSLTPYEGGQYGSGWILARDGVPCLRSRGGGEGVGLVYYDGTGAPVVWNFGMTTSTGLQVVTRCMPSGPEFTTTNPADCADLFTLPMTFDCDRVVPGSCPSVAW
jgi:hypothetical protein